MGALMFIKKRLIPNVFSHIVIRDRAQQPAFKRHEKSPVSRCVFINFIIMQPKHFSHMPEVKREGGHESYHVEIAANAIRSMM